MSTVLAGCASTGKNPEDEVHSLNRSYLQGNQKDFNESDVAQDSNQRPNKGGFSKLSAMQRGNVEFQSASLASNFSKTEKVSVKANQMPLADFIHYTFGELLNANYLLAPAVSKISKK